MDVSFVEDAFHRLRWRMEQLGATGKIGIGLSVFSVLFFFVAVLPRQAESDALMIRAGVLQASLKTAPQETKGKPARRIYGSEALRVFYDFFPRIDSTPRWITEVVRSAAQHDVEISGTSYRMVREKDVKLARYEMLLPIRGEYRQVRGFIADALHAVPAMALVDVVIRRESVESELLEANVKFNLYLSEPGK